MLCLACSTVTEFAVEWLLSAQLVFHLSAVTCTLELHWKVLVLFMNTIGWPQLPLMFALDSFSDLMRSRMCAVCIFNHTDRCARLVRQVCVEGTNGKSAGAGEAGR